MKKSPTDNSCLAIKKTGKILLNKFNRPFSLAITNGFGHVYRFQSLPHLFFYFQYLVPIISNKHYENPPHKTIVEAIIIEAKWTTDADYYIFVGFSRSSLVRSNTLTYLNILDTYL